MRQIFMLWLVSGTQMVFPWGPGHSTLAGAQAECPLTGTWSERSREAWDSLQFWSIDKRRGPLTFWIMSYPVEIDA